MSQRRVGVGWRSSPGGRGGPADAVQHAQDVRAHLGIQRLEFSERVFAGCFHPRKRP